MSTSGFRMHTGCTEFQSNSCPPTVDIAAFRVVSDYTCLIYQYYDSNLKPLDQYFNYIPARTIPNILLNFDNAVVILRPYSVNLSFMHGCTLSSIWHEPGVNLPVLELYHLFRLLLNTKVNPGLPCQRFRLDTGCCHLSVCVACIVYELYTYEAIITTLLLTKLNK